MAEKAAAVSDQVWELFEVLSPPNAFSEYLITRPDKVLAANGLSREAEEIFKGKYRKVDS